MPPGSTAPSSRFQAQTRQPTGRPARKRPFWYNEGLPEVQVTQAARHGAPRIGFLGAGAIGGYLSVRMSASGVPVVLVGREGIAAVRHRFEAIDLEGRVYRPAANMEASAEAAHLADVDACVVCVKSSDTAEAGRALASVLRPEAVVISLQNGIRNVAQLRAAGLANRVIPGLVTFNVRREGPVFHKATSGPVMMGPGAGAEVVAAFAGLGEAYSLQDDMDGALFGKLLLNLNNGLCALSGISIHESLRSYDLRFCFSAAMSEGLAVLKAAGHSAERIGRLAPSFIRHLLLLPDFLFYRVARPMMTIDPQARSSTLQDLERGKPTEIDFLNGEIAALGKAAGVPTPVNGWITSEVHRLERGGLPPAYLRPAEIRTAVEALLPRKEAHA